MGGFCRQDTDVGVVGWSEALKRLVVTGGAGFIGSHLVALLARERPGWRVLTLDALTYAGNLANLQDLPSGFDHQFLRGDVRDPESWREACARLGGAPDAIVNCAAESHVDRSIDAPTPAVETNVGGVAAILEFMRPHPGIRLLQVSTDEVYGSSPRDGLRLSENSPLCPSSPYAATKASGDLLVLAWCRTFGLDVVVTRSCNNYGPRQFPEKLIPLMILHARMNRPLPVYGTGHQVRGWMHVEDHCRGLLRALEQGRSGEVYHFGGRFERRNLEVVQAIADQVAGRRDGITFVCDRPGHDLRYALDDSKSRHELGWDERWCFPEGLRATVEWYLQNEWWWRPIWSRESSRRGGWGAGGVSGEDGRWK